MRKLKKISLLKRLAAFTGVLALLGVFGLCMFSTFNQDHNKVQNVSAVSNEPPSTDIYNYYSSVSTNYYFDWTYLTYDVSDNNSNNRNLRVYSGTPSSLTGLLFVFNDSITSFGDYYSYDLDFYSYYYLNNNSYFYNFDRLVLNFNNILYFDNGNSVTVYNYQGWQGTVYSKQILFVGGTDIANNDLITLLMSRGTFYYFYEFQDYLNQVSTLQGQVSSLESQVSSLENANTSLNNQITSLNNQISDLRSQLNSAILNARRDTYIIDIKTEYELVIDAYVNIENSFDYYIVPKRIVAKSSIDICDATGDLVERHANLVDSYDFQYLWYYRPVDLLTFLYINISDSWLLNVPYYSGSENYSYFDLTNVNYYIQDWLFDFKTDISYSDNVYFRNQVYDYCLLIADFVSSNSMIYEDGYNIGYDNGFSNGKTEGYSQGKADGFEDGVAMDSTVFTIFNGILTVAMVPVNFFLAIFNFEILGINLSGFIRALITVILTIIIIRTVFGGKGANE